MNYLFVGNIWVFMMLIAARKNFSRSVRVKTLASIDNPICVHLKPSAAQDFYLDRFG